MLRVAIKTLFLSNLRELKENPVNEQLKKFASIATIGRRVTKKKMPMLSQGFVLTLRIFL